MDSGEQFGISFKGTVKNIFGNKGDWKYFKGTREHRPLWGPLQIKKKAEPEVLL